MGSSNSTSLPNAMVILSKSQSGMDIKKPSRVTHLRRGLSSVWGIEAEVEGWVPLTCGVDVVDGNLVNSFDLGALRVSPRQLSRR